MGRVLFIIPVVAAVMTLANVPAQAQNMRGGMTAQSSIRLPATPDRQAQRRVRMEVRQLVEELMAVRARNGGALPESDRLRLQARYDQLRAEFRRAG